MKKYITGVAALLIAAVGISTAANKTTTFYFQGPDVNAYYQEEGWKELDNESCPATGLNPCTVSHPSISTPAALASALAGATGSTIQAKIANIGASIVEARPTVAP
ncbi:hypothetical protein MKQ70_32030 [Chitinophaga sedimenti]|uniref:hypothetical protein n=1 Tax=Chitinophaga sedimenti TaxID=2033606 RepID=UPI002002AA31|nr:hypothetical protein [Chitinophaga sedimenti]MCK7559347.1 hypothetical protein [Chitinophaga sedimenti]